MEKINLPVLKNDFALMKYNKSDKIKKAKRDYKKIAIQLWMIIDDIDTSLDLFKPEESNFTKYLVKKIEKRHEYLQSDGYELF